MLLEPGQQLAHYRIERLLGQGGMGAVFLAEDTKLGRKVALKVLPPEMAGTSDRLERFRREAKLLAALDHPGIVTVYSVEEEAGTHFLTMQLVEGDSLDRSIPKEGMPAEDLLAIATQLAVALGAAHEKGIIHRDLKPANVMRTKEGRVKVLDFGLAKMSASRDSSSSELSTALETRQGVVMGTVAYMSPEQVEGRELDHRTDIFSLGVLLYEMATGQRPFRSDSRAGLISAILRDTPGPASSVRPDLPAALDAVIAGCLRKDPGRRFQTAAEIGEALKRPAPAPGPAASRQPLVGRDTERALLEAALDAAARGEGSLILLGGEPGVGKTRLAAEALAAGRARGMLALTGHAYEEEAAPFITAVEILEEMTRTVPPDDLRRMLGDGASEMARLMPELRQRYPDIPAPVELAPEQQRRYLFNSVLDFVGRAGRARPIVMLFDDLHWADESSLRLLEHVAPHVAGIPVLMLGTYRDVELDVGKPFEKTLARLVRQKLARRLVIKRLPESDVAALLSALGGADVPASLVRAIHQETDGNPFFVTEVFEHLAEEGRLHDDEGRWRTDLDVSELDVPEGVRLVIGRRLERLDPKTPKSLTLAAVIGRRFDLRLLEASSEPAADSDEALAAVEEAEAARLIAPVAGSREARNEFVHELIRHTLLSSLSTPRRQRLHLRVAEAMERIHGEKAAEHANDLAHHLYQAGGAAPAAKTRRYLRLAGIRSMEAAAAEEALVAFERALEIEDEMPPEEHAQLLFHRGLARRAQGHWDEAIRDWHEALPALEQAGDVDLVARICRDLAHKLVWENRTDDAKGIVARGLRAVGDGTSAGRCRLLAILGYAQSLSMEFAESEATNDRAMAIAGELGDDHLLGGELLLARHFLYQHSLRPRLMAEFAEKAIEVSRSTGRSWDHSNALGAAVLVWPLQGRYDETETHAEEIWRLAEREGDFGTKFHLRVALGLLEMARGRFSAARESLESSMELCREVDFPWVSIARAMLGTIRLFQGDVAGAAADHEAAVAAGVIGTWRGFEAAHLLHALAHTDPAGAISYMKTLRPLLPAKGEVHASGAWILAAATVETAAVAGDRAASAELLPVMRQWGREGGVQFWSFGLTEKLAGIAAAAGERWEDAEGHFDEALRLADRLPHRVDQAEIRRWHARMLLDRGSAGDKDRARTLLAEARHLYEQIGMPFHQILAETLLKQAS